MYKVNVHILEYFIKQNKLSAARLYFYVKNRFNNHLHLSDFDQIREDLQISDRVIKKNLRQLYEMCIVDNHSEGYWRFRSWKKFKPVCKNRNLKTSLLILRNLKPLRNIYYLHLYRWSHTVAANNRAERKCLKSSSSFEQVSASFVRAVTGTDLTPQCLLFHINRSEQYGIAELIKGYDVLFTSSSYEECKEYQQYLKKDTVIKKQRFFYNIVRYKSNLVLPLI